MLSSDGSDSPLKFGDMTGSGNQVPHAVPRNNEESKRMHGVLPLNDKAQLREGRVATRASTAALG